MEKIHAESSGELMVGMGSTREEIPTMEEDDLELETS